MEIRQIERLFSDRCDIYRAEESIEEYESKSVYSKIYENVKCRISFKSIQPNTQSETAAKSNFKIKLFTSNNIDILSGDIFVIDHMGIKEKYKSASAGIRYATHQETEMEIFEENP